MKQHEKRNKEHTLIKNLLTTISAEEINCNLELALSVFIQHAPASDLTKANFATLVNKLNIFFFKLDSAIKKDG